MNGNEHTDGEIGSGQALRIEAPDRSPNDEAIPVRVTGAPAGVTVEFTATLVDNEGVEWTSSATFDAGGGGTVDLTEDAPETGSYDGVAPMGWLWSMRTDAEARFASLGASPTFEVDLQASTGETTAERTIMRVVYDEGVEATDIEHPDLVGQLFVPPGDGPHPAVLNLHGSAGPGSERFGRALATHGFLVCSLQYFGDTEPLPDGLARVPLSYFDAATEWLRERPAARGDRLGVVGASRGAELALLLGARRDWVGPVVSYAGSGVVWDTPDGTPAWVADGEAVPHLSGEGPPERTDDGEVVTRPVLERGFENASEEERRAATIAVEAVDGPVLLLSGGADRVWPARRLSAVAVERLERHEFPHAFDHLTYDGCGHLVGVPYVPLSGVEAGDVTARATARAAADSWPRVLECLERGLGDWN